MSQAKLVALPLVFAAALAAAACSRTTAPSGEAAPPPAQPPAQQALSIDESTLPAALHFSADDLDKTKDPCADFGGYVNSKWLAANPIPADRASWGPGAMLVERAL